MLKIFILMLLLCIGCTKDELEAIPVDDFVIVENQTEEQEAKIYVYVCGAVKNPGVYELEEGSRTFEAIEAAGGLSEDASLHAVNQAQVLKDEAKLYIPTEVETEDSGKINLNMATKEELMTIPGVGEAKANQIISYRENNGSFSCIEDIMSISGIKEGLFEKIREYITV